MKEYFRWQELSRVSRVSRVFQGTDPSKWGTGRWVLKVPPVDLLHQHEVLWAFRGRFIVEIRARHREQFALLPCAHGFVRTALDHVQSSSGIPSFRQLFFRKSTSTLNLQILRPSQPLPNLQPHPRKISKKRIKSANHLDSYHKYRKGRFI